MEDSITDISFIVTEGMQDVWEKQLLIATEKLDFNMPFFFAFFKHVYLINYNISMLSFY